MRDWIDSLDEIDQDCVYQYEYLLGRKLTGHEEYSEVDGQVNEMILEWTSREEFFEAYPDLKRYAKQSEIASLLDDVINKKSCMLIDSYGDEVEVIPKINMYRDNDNLYIGLDCFDEDLEAWDSYCDLTVNIFALPYLESAVDITYSGEEKIKFLTENGFGEPTGQTIASGFCVFPVFRFNEDKLKEIDPEAFAQYAKAHGRDVEKHPDLETQISSAKEKCVAEKDTDINKSVDDIER